MKTKRRLNPSFFLVAAGAGTLAGATVLLTGTGWRRYRQYRARKQVMAR